jgi:hypothetical protein
MMLQRAMMNGRVFRPGRAVHAGLHIAFAKQAFKSFGQAGTCRFLGAQENEAVFVRYDHERWLPSRALTQSHNYAPAHEPFVFASLLPDPGGCLHPDRCTRGTPCRDAMIFPFDLGGMTPEAGRYRGVYAAD